jgi:hypothetical protein
MVRIIDLDSMGGAELTDNNYFIVSNTGTPSGLKKISYSEMISGFALDVDADTTYSQSAVTTTGGALLRLTAGGSGSGNDDVKFASGTNVTVAYTNADTITISASGVDSGAIVSLINSDYVQARQDYAYSSLTGVPSTFTPSTHNQAWSTITSTPTTLSGYGITDVDSNYVQARQDYAYSSLTGVPSTFTPSTHNQAWSTITSTPTTLSGYGITDALDSALVIDLIAANAVAGGLDSASVLSLTSSATQSYSGAKTFNDDIILAFGDDDDLQITANTDAYVSVNAGDLYFIDSADATKFTFAMSTGDFTASGNVTAYSDERLKSNVRTIDDGLDKILRMRGVYFDKDGKSNTGVIAQEVEKVLPEVVFSGEYKSVAYGNIVGVLIEAVKTLTKRVEELEKK